MEVEVWSVFYLRLYLCISYYSFAKAFWYTTDEEDSLPRLGKRVFRTNLSMPVDWNKIYQRNTLPSAFTNKATNVLINTNRCKTSIQQFAGKDICKKLNNPDIIQCKTIMYDIDSCSYLKKFLERIGNGYTKKINRLLLWNIFRKYNTKITMGTLRSKDLTVNSQQKQITLSAVFEKYRQHP